MKHASLPAGVWLARAWLAPAVVWLAPAAVWLAPRCVQAYPPHAVVSVKPGDVDFERVYQVTAIGVEDPSIATAELLPSQELLFTGKRVGTTEVAMLAGGKVVGIRVHVQAPGTLAVDDGGAKLAAVEKLCPKHELVGSGPDRELGVTPDPPACQAALMALFQTDAFTIKQIAVNFTEVSIQAQLVKFDQALKAAGLSTLALAYQGATLVITGTVTQAQAGKLALTLYLNAVGGVPLDATGLTIEAPAESAPDGGAPDAGTEPKPWTVVPTP